MSQSIIFPSFLRHFLGWTSTKQRVKCLAMVLVSYKSEALSISSLALRVHTNSRHQNSMIFPLFFHDIVWFSMMPNCEIKIQKTCWLISSFCLTNHRRLICESNLIYSLLFFFCCSSKRVSLSQICHLFRVFLTRFVCFGAHTHIFSDFHDGI